MVDPAWVDCTNGGGRAVVMVEVIVVEGCRLWKSHHLHQNYLRYG